MRGSSLKINREFGVAQPPKLPVKELWICPDLLDGTRSKVQAPHIA